MDIITESKIKDWYFENNNGKFLSSSEFKSKKKELTEQYLKELLDPEDSDQYDIYQPTGKSFEKTIIIGGDIFQVDADLSLAMEGFYKFVFKLIKSNHIVKPKLIGNNTSKYIKDLNQYEYGLTNSGNPIQVLKTLQSIMYRFIKKYSPRGISFKDFDEGKRGKVYGYMAKKISQKSGYFLLSANHYFFLFKDKNDMLEIKSNMDI